MPNKTLFPALAALLLLPLANASVADSLRVQQGQQFTLPAGQSKIHYRELVLEADASLVIPESYGGQTLTLRADRFEASRGAKILQYFKSRAAQGAQGGQGAQPGYGGTGFPGGNGQPGQKGADTVRLNLELGIAKLAETTVLLRSQAGGHGGRGGKGGIGGGPSCNEGEDGGDGGRGGTGGPGAAPGAVGPVNVVWWPVGTAVAHFHNGQPLGLAVSLQAGEGGWGGPSGPGGDGHGGKDCFIASDRGSGSPGPAGKQGEPYRGMPSYLPVVFERRELPQ